MSLQDATVTSRNAVYGFGDCVTAQYVSLQSLQIALFLKMQQFNGDIFPIVPPLEMNKLAT